jgi:hypothetical protein
MVLQQYSGLAAGNFSLVVTDANGCVTAENGTISTDPTSNLDGYTNGYTSYMW